MTTPTNFVPRIRAALQQLGRSPGVGLDELATELEQFVAEKLNGRRPPTYVVLDWPVAEIKPEVKKAKPPVKSRRRRMEAPPSEEPATTAAEPGIATWRDYFGFAPDEPVNRARLIEAFRRQPMGQARELYFRIAKSEVGT